MSIPLMYNIIVYFKAKTYQEFVESYKIIQQHGGGGILSSYQLITNQQYKVTFNYLSIKASNSGFARLTKLCDSIPDIRVVHWQEEKEKG